ncbi:MAG: hypothetical protein SGJ20_21015 [Planctomycetota bacterium]|nr:hypothetical protein [Planctomycetota bacterium]
MLTKDEKKTEPLPAQRDREELRRELLRLILKNEDKRKTQTRSSSA